ncbi:hypothetical protein LTS18_012338, partial [Coniosporium uncinatum]
WDTLYAREISNHSASADDEGTIWFSDADAEEKILDYLEQLSDEGELCKFSSDDGPVQTSFLDLGTGNGHMLFALREAGWMGRMVGVDYSSASVDLARRVKQQRAKESRVKESEGEEDGEGEAVSYEGIEFVTWDVLKEAPGEWLEDGKGRGKGFDVVLDKGTFDAISLSSEVDGQGRRICEGYRERLEPLVRSRGLFLVTSCNWTGDELENWFETPDGSLHVKDHVRYPSFTFGGKSGQKVATVCFEK